MGVPPTIPYAHLCHLEALLTQAEDGDHEEHQVLQHDRSHWQSHEQADAEAVVEPTLGSGIAGFVLFQEVELIGHVARGHDQYRDAPGID